MRGEETSGTRSQRTSDPRLGVWASPEGSGEPWKGCEHEQLWDQVQDGLEGKDQ